MFGKPDSLWRADKITPGAQRIHITEGETAAIALIDADFDNDAGEIVAAAPGASCWRDEWAAQLRGKEIVLWPDDDAAGQRMAERAAASLAQHAARIEIVSAPSFQSVCKAK